MFCVECGKEETIYKNGVCLHCYLKQAQFTKGPAIIDVLSCPRCESYKYKNTWLMEPFPEVLRRHVKDAFHIDPELKEPRIKTDCKEQDRMVACMVRIIGSVGGQTVMEEHPLTVRLKRTTCDVCSREAGGYYEAILQIRSDKRTFSKQSCRPFGRPWSGSSGSSRTAANEGFSSPTTKRNAKGLTIS